MDRSDGLARVQRTRFNPSLVVRCRPVRSPRLRGTKRVAGVETRLQDSMRRIRPAITEGSRDDRVLRLRRNERRYVHRMSDRLSRSNEPCADPDCIRACGERRSHRTAGADSPRGDERHSTTLRTSSRSGKSPTVPRT